MTAARRATNAPSYNGALNARVKGLEWQPALALLSTMAAAKVDADATSYGPAVTTRGIGSEWQRASGWLSTMGLPTVLVITVSHGAASGIQDESGISHWACSAPGS